MSAGNTLALLGIASGVISGALWAGRWSAQLHPTSPGEEVPVPLRPDPCRAAQLVIGSARADAAPAAREHA
jgi:hypothetical protein